MCFFTTSTSAYRLLSEVYGDEIPSERTCRVWFERFRNGGFDVRDKERPGQPKTRSTVVGLPCYRREKVIENGGNYFD